MKYILSLFLLIGIMTNISCQSFKNVVIDNGQTGQPCEPSIHINPKDPNNIVAGAILDRVYISNDGGQTWKGKRLQSPYGVYGDPCVIADMKGNFYYFHLSNSEGKAWASDGWLDRIVCQTSYDKGQDWSKGSFMGLNGKKDQDKEWGVANHINGEIYVTWTQFDLYDSKKRKDSTNILFSKSVDMGKSWSTPIRLNYFGGDCLDDDMTVEGAVPAVGSKGEIYVAWAWNDKIYFDKSLDNGMTWMKKDQVVAEQKAGWAIDIPGISRTNGFPVTACDISGGKYDGTIYVNWSDQRNGKNDTDIWLIKSNDQGKTWTKPKRVNDDAPGKHQFFSWMSVDPITGYIYIIFYDRRNYQDIKTDVYMAYSKNGGKTFKNVKISETPFKPTKGVFFGDYNNISAYDGIVRPIWTRMDNGKTSVWTALINFNKKNKLSKCKRKKIRKIK